MKHFKTNLLIACIFISTASFSQTEKVVPPAPPIPKVTKKLSEMPPLLPASGLMPISEVAAPPLPPPPPKSPPPPAAPYEN